MRLTGGPSQPDANYRWIVEQMDELKGDKLSDAIPRELFQPRLGRSLLGFFASYAVYAAAVLACSVAHWSLYVPLWLLAGLGGWGLHCIAHDCGHGSFSRYPRLNNLIGHLSLLPMLYPFQAWRHVHNLHHKSTNSLELDTDWRPIDPHTYERMPLSGRLKYYLNRTFFFWLGTAAYQLYYGFRPGYYPQRRMRAEVRRSIVIVALFAGTYLPLLGYYTGWQGVLVHFVGPWLAMHAWFSMTTLMHHTAPDLPFLPAGEWQRNGSRLLMTTDYRYPKWLHFLTHNISIHTAHHVAPKVPSYNLPSATRALKASYPGKLRERPFSLKTLWRIIRHCHLYDPGTGYYLSFAAWRRQRREMPTAEASG